MKKQNKILRISLFVIILLVFIFALLIPFKEHFMDANERLNEYFLKTIIGYVILGVITSFVFINCLIFLYRPSVKISPNICKMTIKGKEYFVFKFVNKTRYDLYDVKIKLVKKIPYIIKTGNKINYTFEDVPISTRLIDYIPRYSTDDENGDYAILIRTEENIHSDVVDSSITLMFIVLARHSFSNLSRVKTQEYLTGDCIHSNKQFQFGKKLDVM